jgi:hypothetical protein
MLSVTTLMTVKSGVSAIVPKAATMTSGSGPWGVTPVIVVVPPAPRSRVDPGVGTLIDEVSGGLFTDINVVAHSKVLNYLQLVELTNSTSHAEKHQSEAGKPSGY